jgi:hypothetical protein
MTTKPSDVPADDGSIIGIEPIDPEESITFDDEGNIIQDGLAKYRERAAKHAPPQPKS